MTTTTCASWTFAPVEIIRTSQVQGPKVRYKVQRPGPASWLVSMAWSTTCNYNLHQHHPDRTSTAQWMTSATVICNGAIQTLWLLNQLITPVWYVSVLWLDPAYSTIYVGVTLCLQSKSADNLAVNRPFHWRNYLCWWKVDILYPSCSAGEGERARVTNDILN